MSSTENRTKSLFLAAIENHPPEEWADYLDQASGGDDALRGEVEALLRSHAQLGTFHEQAPATLTMDLPPRAESAAAVIGPYKLLEKIGEGGMGVVYMAEQAEPVQRRVALKIIKPGMDTRQVIARFEAERQALALMDHPNIAKVFDAGTIGRNSRSEAAAAASGPRSRPVPNAAGAESSETCASGREPARDLDRGAGDLPPSGGRPYFVMELVKGLPITRYCDERKLSLRERLELFVPVCQAIQHAHQKGIIHRDIKPTNVLVALYDGLPVPKVIDFGVAKAVGPRLTEQTMFTQFGQLVGTLEYMSPEQAQFNQLDVDTRSDVYSLGVLLYELLTGTTPFERQRLRSAAFDEMLRIIREEEPHKPSTRLLSSTTPAAIATNRHSEPARLTKAVRGELDWIVMKSLDKDRSRRYETANGLARDIQCYLHDEPVQACPPSTVYRLRKFARRNRAPLAMTAIVAAALLLTSVVSVWNTRQALRHQRELGLKAAALQTANDELEQAQQEALARLYQSNLEGARARRWSRRPGRRFEALESLREAAALLPSLPISETEGTARRQELRDEAIACLTLADVRLQRRFQVTEPEDVLVVCDARMSRYAVSDSRGALRVHHLSDDRLLHQFTEDGPIARRTLFSADGRHLLAKRDRGPQAYLDVYDLERDRSAWISGDFPPAYDWAVSRDGRLVALGQPDNTICLLEVSSGREVQRLPSSGVPPHALCFHPDGTRLAQATRSRTEHSVLIWDLNRSEIASRRTFPRDVRALDWSSDGRLLALASGDHCAYVWTVEEGTKPLTVCRGHQAEVVDVRFNESGGLLVTGSWDGTTRLWDPGTGRELLSVPDWRPRPQFGADDRSLKASHAVWELAPGHECRILPAHEGLGRFKGPSHAVVHPDGSLIASCGADGVRLWTPADGREIAHLPIGWVTSVFFPDGESLMTSGQGGQFRWPLRLDADPIATLHVGPPEPLSSLPATVRASVDRSGQMLALLANGQMQLVDLAAPSQPRLLASRANLIDPILSPDGRWVAAGSWHGQGVRLWDADDGQVVKDWLMDFRHVQAAFSPDGRWLVTGSGREYQFWRTGTWEAAHTIPRRAAGAMPGRMTFASDGGLLAVALSRQVVQLVDPESGRALATLQPVEPGEITSLCFSNDGATLVVTTGNHHLQIWDLRQIRQGLRELDLDWDRPPIPPSAPRGTSIRQAVVHVGDAATGSPPPAR